MEAMDNMQSVLTEVSLFHSVPYYTSSADNLEKDQFNLLGSQASLWMCQNGCQ